MSDSLFLKKLHQLPEHLKVEVMDYLEFLEHKYNSKEKQERVFGIAKGKFIMAPDFDEPLEDFKDYM